MMRRCVGSALIAVTALAASWVPDVEHDQDAEQHRVR